MECRRKMDPAGSASARGALIRIVVILVLLISFPGHLLGQAIDGLTAEQRFFLGWANVWCDNRTDELSRMRVTVDPHSPGKWRVNGVASNMPEFRDAFHCKADAPMVRHNACRVW